MEKWQSTEYDLSTMCDRRAIRKHMIEIRLTVLIVFSAAVGMFGMQNKRCVLHNNLIDLLQLSMD